MNRRLIAVAAAVAVVVTGCGIPTQAPNGPTGAVTAHSSRMQCVGKPVVCRRKYRIKVRPDGGGEVVTIGVWKSEQQACAVGKRYPACLPKES